jgi:Spy/CpxP family protein refolding chaperone
MIIKLLIYVLVLAFVSPVWAGSWGQGPGRGMNYGLGPCADTELDLIPEQASRMKAVQSDYQKNLRPLRMELMDKRAELKMCEPEKGKETVRTTQLRDQVRELHEQIREIWLRYKMECRAILTPEQLDRLNSVKGSGGPRSGMGRMGWADQ